MAERCGGSADLLAAYELRTRVRSLLGHAVCLRVDPIAHGYEGRRHSSY